MRIEKKYHTQAAKEWDELLQEEERRKAGLSEEERLREQERLHREADAIIQKVEEMDKKHFCMVNPQKLKHFSRLSSAALQMAEILTLDVMIQTEKRAGRIRLSTDCFLLNPMCPRNMREILGELFREADDVWIRAEGELIVIEFVFDLVVKI